MEKDDDKQQHNMLKSLEKLVNALGYFRSLTPVTWVRIPLGSPINSIG